MRGEGAGGQLGGGVRLEDVGGGLEGFGGGGSAGGCLGGGVHPWEGFARGGGGALLQNAYLQGGCVFGVGLGKLLVAVVK